MKGGNELIDIVMFSGGAGSERTAQRVGEYGNKLMLLFTDTLIEDKDSYRFIVESASNVYRLPVPYDLLKLCKEIPDIKSEADINRRKTLLPIIAELAMKRIPNLVWVMDGRTPWDVFKDVKWIGNSRLAQCSHKLKQELAEKKIKADYKPDEVTLYVGIDWTEIHRLPKIVENWLPYRIKAPMTEPPYMDKYEMLRMIKQDGIKKPRLYDKGFSHNNCGGFCVRGGQAHFVNLLKEDRDYYIYNEQKELDMQEYLGRNDISILTRTVNGIEQNITLQQLRLEWESGLGRQIDMNDIGGCGCFAQYG